ncbi:MAG: HTH-type transcriptional regulator CynR, partial [Pseudomonadota bacterium]
MDFKQLQAFVSVAEQGSFTRAAQQLNVAQPALSRLVRALELELRQTLLERNGRGARPTQAGKRLLDHARGILHQLDRAHEDMAQLRGGQTGSIALGLPPSVARVLTVALTRAFRAELPAVHLTIREDLSFALQDGLQQGRLD